MRTKKKKKKKKKKEFREGWLQSNYFSKCKATGILKERFPRKEGQGYRPATTSYKKQNLFS